MFRLELSICLRACKCTGNIALLLFPIRVYTAAPGWALQGRLLSFLPEHPLWEATFTDCTAERRLSHGFLAWEQAFHGHLSVFLLPPLPPSPSSLLTGCVMGLPDPGHAQHPHCLSCEPHLPPIWLLSVMKANWPLSFSLLSCLSICLDLRRRRRSIVQTGLLRCLRMQTRLEGVAALVGPGGLVPCGWCSLTLAV